MSYLLKLPQGVITDLCSFYLDIVDVARLDSAHCNKEGRHQYLKMAYFGGNLLSSPRVVLTAHGVPSVLLMSKKPAIDSWLAKRRTSIDTAIVRLAKDWKPLDVPLVSQPIITRLILITTLHDGHWLTSSLDQRAQWHASLAALLPNLRTLELWDRAGQLVHSSVLAADFVHVYPVALHKLSLLGLTLRTRDLQTICTRFPLLTSLDLSSCTVEAEAAQNHLPLLAALTRLRHLVMPNTAITAQVGEAIAQESLRTVHLTGAVSAVAIDALGANCPKLYSFTLAGYVESDGRNTDTKATPFAINWPQLRFFKYCSTKANSDEAAVRCILWQCQRISTIDMDRVSGRTVDVIASSCPALQRLTLSDHPQELSCSVLQQLGANSPLLHTVKVVKCALRDGALHTLVSSCPMLRSLSVVECAMVTDDGLRAVSHSGLAFHTLEFVNLQGISDDGVKVLVLQNAALLHLSMHGSASITDNALHAVAECCPALITLDISGCKSVTDAGVYTVATSCEQLRRLLASGCNGVDRECWDQIRQAFPLLFVKR